MSFRKQRAEVVPLSRFRRKACEGGLPRTILGYRLPLRANVVVTRVDRESEILITSGRTDPISIEPNTNRRTARLKPGRSNNLHNINHSLSGVDACVDFML